MTIEDFEFFALELGRLSQEVDELKAEAVRRRCVFMRAHCDNFRDLIVRADQRLALAWPVSDERLALDMISDGVSSPALSGSVEGI